MAGVGNASPIPATATPLRVLSLGAGVQSTAMLLMGLAGTFGAPPDVALFADSGWEPRHVYAHLDWLTATVAPFPILRVSRGSLRDDLLAATAGRKQRVANPPYFVKKLRGKPGMLKRRCTGEYKIALLDRATLQLLREHGRAVAEKWIGISLDEIERMKPAAHPRFVHRYPLVEHGIARSPGNRFARDDCISWLTRHGYPEPPKSACVGCPYHDDAYWRMLKTRCPVEWADAVAMDAAIRRGLPGVRGEAYLHRSRKPLAEVDFSTAAERGQTDLFGDECSGLCGV